MAPSSRPPLSTGLSLPRSNSRESHGSAATRAPVASTSQAPLAAPASSRAQSGDQQLQGQPRKVKKKKTGRGRMMMVKVFYSLSSPRFGGGGASPTPSVSTPTLQPPSSAFLAVLDPALANIAPSPSPEPDRPPQQNYTCLARLSAPVWVQLMGSKPAPGDEEKTEYGKLTLKTCLSAICISRPELVTDPTKDYAVSAVDPYESSLQPSSLASTSTAAQGGGQGLMEGKGMLSWNLAEKREGTTWVCGRVMVDEREKESRARKKRRTEGGATAQDEEDEEDDSDDESVKETLEVWLQLVERPSFTQTQFLTSLRSFANPAQPQDSSDRPSSPPRRQSFSHQQQQHPSSAQPRPSQLGDPIKRKRPRHSDENRLPVALPSPALTSSSTTAPAFLAPAPVASTSTALQLQDPRVLALLAQLIPSLGANSDIAKSGVVPLSLESEQGQALLPAIRTLAEYYGVELPPSVTSASASLPSTQEDISVELAQPAPSQMPRETDKGKGKETAPTRKGRRPEHYTVIDQPDPTSKNNPFDADGGCTNCKRRKSTKWREAYQEDGTHVTACNACGIFYNKNGYHRKQGDRATSPNRAPTSTLPGPSSTKPVGRPLQGRLTATCEQELKKIKTKKGKNASPSSSRVAAMLPPLSPSKHIGPSLSRSPGTAPWSAWNHRGAVPSHTMTSPGRSPRRGRSGAGNLFGFAATSPVRATDGFGTGAGLRSGYESDGEGRGNAFAFGGGPGSIFGGGQQSPSPKKREQRQMPAYLLTASPGTALDRILNDTNIDLNSFDVEMPDAAETLAGRSSQRSAAAARAGAREDGLALTDTEEEQAQGGLTHALSFYLRSLSPDLKENAKPSGASSMMALDSKDGSHSNLFNSLLDPALHDTTTTMSAPAHRPLNTTDAPTTDLDPFESVLSSLRRDFNTRLSSNALTAPSSPVPSSPCVQPRTSSATPGTKGKAPQSCGRPAPTILDGFINGLVPAFAMGAAAEGETPVSDSDAWTPASPSDVEAGDQTMTLDGAQSTNEAPRPAGSGRLLMPNRAVSTSFLPSHLVATSDVASEFDYGSLPPSSPPLLPSEAFPTPSDFGSGVTPEEEGYLESEDATMTMPPERRSTSRPTTTISADEQRAMTTLLQSLSDQGRGTALEGLLAGGEGTDKIQLDRATVNRLLQMISANNGAPSPSATSASSKPSPAYLAAGSNAADSPADSLSPALVEEPFDLLKSFEEARAGGGDLFEAFAGFESM